MATNSVAALFRPFSAPDNKPFMTNSIAMAPMCQYSVETRDGMADDWHLAHYGARALGGVGAIIVEATAVLPNGRISPYDLGLWSDAHIEPLQRITSFVHQRSPTTKIGIQLAHAGRKASTARPWNDGAPGHSLTREEGGWPDQIVGPSALPFSAQSDVPAPLTEEQIAEYVESWAAAARRAISAGFDFIEIHAAHGYLLHQFCSPISNTRTDEYGGSFENRTRFCREVVQAIRDTIAESTPLWVRLSCTDYVDDVPSWTLNDSIELSKQLKELGVQLIDCSGGGLSSAQKIKVGPGYQVPFAEAIRAQAGIATGAVGLITDANQANEIIESGKADIVIVGRQLLREPSWPLAAARTLNYGAQITYPPQYAYSRLV